MLETPHVAVAAAIATKIPNPFISIPLSFLSHFALERVPHWNPHLNRETKMYGHPTKKTTYIVILDVAISLIVGGTVAARSLPDYTHSVTILMACLASVLPDLVEGPYFFLGIKNTHISKWIKFQKSIQVDTSPFPGLLTQFITVAVSLWWVFS